MERCISSSVAWSPAVLLAGTTSNGSAFLATELVLGHTQEGSIVSARRFSVHYCKYLTVAPL